MAKQRDGCLGNGRSRDEQQQIQNRVVVIWVYLFPGTLPQLTLAQPPRPPRTGLAAKLGRSSRRLATTNYSADRANRRTAAIDVIEWAKPRFSARNRAGGAIAYLGVFDAGLRLGCVGASAVVVGQWSEDILGGKYDYMGV